MGKTFSFSYSNSKSICALLIYRYQFSDTGCKKINKHQSNNTGIHEVQKMCLYMLAIHEDCITKCGKQAKEANTCKFSTM